MKNTLRVLTVSIAMFVAITANAISYNQNITAIFGGGNPDGGWTVDTVSGITIGLRGKNRTTGDTANVNGTYYVPLGFAAPNRGYGNVEFSISTDPVNLGSSGYNYWLSFDTDPTLGQSFTTINLSLLNDNSYGNSGTPNGTGVEGNYSLSLFNSLMQNSINQFHLGVDPTVSGTYDYLVFATPDFSPASIGSGPSVGIRFNVGDGAASVPDGGMTAGMLGMGLLGMGFIRKEQKQKSILQKI